MNHKEYQQLVSTYESEGFEWVEEHALRLTSIIGPYLYNTTSDERPDGLMDLYEEALGVLKERRARHENERSTGGMAGFAKKRLN